MGRDREIGTEAERGRERQREAERERGRERERERERERQRERGGGSYLPRVLLERGKYDSDQLGSDKTLIRYYSDQI